MTTKQTEGLMPEKQKQMKVEYALKRFKEICLVIPECLTKRIQSDIDIISKELECNTRINLHRKIMAKNKALNKIANTYGKMHYGKIDNKTVASEMRKIAREALK